MKREIRKRGAKLKEKKLGRDRRGNCTGRGRNTGKTGRKQERKKINSRVKKMGEKEEEKVKI